MSYHWREIFCCAAVAVGSLGCASTDVAPVDESEVIANIIPRRISARAPSLTSSPEELRQLFTKSIAKIPAKKIPSLPTAEELPGFENASRNFTNQQTSRPTQNNLRRNQPSLIEDMETEIDIEIPVEPSADTPAPAPFDPSQLRFSRPSVLD